MPTAAGLRFPAAVAAWQTPELIGHGRSLLAMLRWLPCRPRLAWLVRELQGLVVACLEQSVFTANGIRGARPRACRRARRRISPARRTQGHVAGARAGYSRRPGGRWRARLKAMPRAPGAWSRDARAGVVVAEGNRPSGRGRGIGRDPPSRQRDRIAVRSVLRSCVGFIPSCSMARKTSTTTRCRDPEPRTANHRTARPSTTITPTARSSGKHRCNAAAFGRATRRSPRTVRPPTAAAARPALRPSNRHGRLV